MYSPINKPSDMDNDSIDANANLFKKETIDSLSSGLLKLYTPSLTHVKKQLTELTSVHLPLPFVAFSPANLPVAVLDYTADPGNPPFSIGLTANTGRLRSGLLATLKIYFRGSEGDKQSVLVDQLHNENLKLSWAQNSAELQEMHDTMKLYQGKLLNIKKDMRSLHDRSVKLKKRTVKLQQHVEKEIYIKNQQKEIELKKEQDLVKKTNEQS